MLALEEFAKFVHLNMANLATTYARLLAERGEGYETIHVDSRRASACSLLKAVTEACQAGTSDPLRRRFDQIANASAPWPYNIEPPQPLLEVECLGQTLTPVVTSLDAGKFLWQILSEVRAAALQTMESATPPLPAIPVDGKEKRETRFRTEEASEKGLQGQEVLSALLRISLEEIPLEEQLERALELVLSTTWLPTSPKGGIFLVEDDPEVLVLKAQRGLGTPLLTICARVPFGRCLCGRAAESRKIEHTACLDHLHENRYEGIATHGHYNVPILVEGKVSGVIVLYLNDGHRRDKHEIAFLEAVANTLAALIKRKQAEAALQEANHELERRVESRTAELAKANEILKAQIAERQQTEEETRRRARREQLTRRIADKMRASPDVASIINTGLNELARALGASRTYVRLSSKLEQDEPANERPGG